MKSGILLVGSNTYRCAHFDEIVNEARTGELTALAACGMALEGSTVALCTFQPAILPMAL